MTKYCLGFLFDPRGEQVVLIQKNHPAWQHGRFNGVGGKIKDGESPAVAMAREFQEEADLVVPPDDWRHFLRLVGADYEVECFLAFATHPEWVGSPESEFVTVCSVDNLPPVIPNVRWMIAMALSFQRGETARSFVVQEVTA